MKNELQGIYSAEKQRLIQLFSDEKARAGDYANPVFGQGKIGARVMLVGEAPGKFEAEAGAPFVGKAGKQLDHMLDMAEICREDAFVTNAVKFRPLNIKITKAGSESRSNRTPAVDEILSAAYVLRAEFNIIRPNVVATLGNAPLRAVLNVMDKPFLQTVGEIHGQPAELKNGEFGFILFPLYHPASGIYNRKLISVMEDDLKKLARLLNDLSHIC